MSTYDTYGRPIFSESEIPLPVDFTSAPDTFAQRFAGEPLALPVERANNSAIDKLFGLNGMERFQTWPERMVRSGVTAPGDALAGNLPTESTLGLPGTYPAGTFDVNMEPRSIPKALGMGNFTVPGPETAIARVQDTAGMAGMSGIGLAPKNVLGTSGSNFYSHLENVIKNSKMEKANPDQWLGYLKNNGVRAEELEFGLGNLPNKQLSREELANYIADNGVKLGEVWKGSKDTGATQRDPDGTILPITTETKYSSYQLPGGENYRELLMTLPEKSKTVKWEDVKNLPNDQLFKRSSENPNIYRSSHWDEPNVLAHIRMNDREVPGVGKTLHVEEIQSDWHQAGRKRGYSDAKQEIDGHDFKWWKEEADRRIKPENREAAGGREAWERAIANRDALDPRDASLVPNAPFKKTWDELALKRVINEAVKNGYDAVSWTPGEAQAARYDLSKQIKELRVSKTHDSPYEMTAIDHKGVAHEMTANKESELANVVGKEMAKKIIENKDAQQQYTGLDLKVGGEGMKSFYDKMLVDKANNLLKKMGGKVEYQEIPQKWNKDKIQYGWEKDGDYYFVNTSNGDLLPTRYNSRQDAQAEMTRLIKENSIDKIKIPIIKITPAMREKIQSEGFPLFSASALIPVNEAPDFGDRKLTPVPYNPFKLTPVDAVPEF